MRLPQDRILHIGTELKDGKVNVVAEWQGEIVRCKDCRYYWDNLSEDDTDEMYGECRWDSDEMPNADDYCSYGERKGGDDE